MTWENKSRFILTGDLYRISSAQIRRHARTAARSTSKEASRMDIVRVQLSISRCLDIYVRVGSRRLTDRSARAIDCRGPIALSRIDARRLHLPADERHRVACDEQVHVSLGTSNRESNIRPAGNLIPVRAIRSSVFSSSKTKPKTPPPPSHHHHHHRA